MEWPLLPLHVVARAHRDEQPDFIRHFDDDHILLISLPEDQRAQLVDGLEAHPTERGRPLSVREDDHSGTGVGKISLSDVRERMSSIPPPMDGEGLAWVLNEPHYALPLRKRPQATLGDADQISMGRSTANDIVLNHRSVSKQHALLEVDELDRFYITDQSSTNFTKVRGRLVEPSAMGSFTPGEEVFLGDVGLRIVDAKMLWDALNTAP